jgi:hypothetical protein
MISDNLRVIRKKSQNVSLWTLRKIYFMLSITIIKISPYC